MTEEADVDLNQVLNNQIKRFGALKLRREIEHASQLTDELFQLSDCTGNVSGTAWVHQHRQSETPVKRKKFALPFTHPACHRVAGGTPGSLQAKVSARRPRLGTKTMGK